MLLGRNVWDHLVLQVLCVNSAYGYFALRLAKLVFLAAESMSIETSENVSLLAIAWDRRVQVAKLVKSELKVCWKWTTDSSAVGLAWLDEQVYKFLGALSGTYFFCHLSAICGVLAFSTKITRVFYLSRFW